VSQQIQFELQDGGTIRVEVSDDSSGVVGPGDQPIASRGERDVVQQAVLRFDDALAVLKPVATSILTKLRDIAEPPDEISVDFGFKLSAEAGAIIAKTAAEANFAVSLLWKGKN
jgi:hypothetical protein